MSKQLPTSDQILLAKIEHTIAKLTDIRSEINQLLVELGTLKKVHSEDRVIYCIFDAVYKITEVTQNELMEKRNSPEYAEPRHIFSFLAKKYTKFSYSKIGSYIKRDHASVRHGYIVIIHAKDTHDTLWDVCTMVEAELITILHTTSESQKTKSMIIGLNPPE